MGMVALPLAVSVFAAAPAHAGSVAQDGADPSKDFSQEVGFVLPWLVEVEGIGGSMGTIGAWAWVHSGPSGTQAGVKGILQQSTHVGPAYFHLNIVKSAIFTYTPRTTTTTTEPGGNDPRDDSGRAATATGPKAELNLVDIGKWAVGIPGFVEWYGELGFTSDTVVDSSGFSFNWKGINKQYVSIGGGLLVFGFDFQPSFSLHVPGLNPAAPPGNVPALGYAAAGAEIGDDGATPGDDGVTPGDDGVTPGDDGVTPGDDGVTPGDDGVTPGDDGVTPGDDDATPQLVADKPGPGEGTPGEGGDNPLNGDEPGAGGDKRRGGDKPAQGGNDDKPRGGDKPAQGGNDDKPRGGDKPGEGGDKPRGGDKPGQNSRDNSGQGGSKPGSGGDRSSGGASRAAADAK